MQQLQPVPPQYSPRTFQNIEERLRRLERAAGGGPPWVQFDPFTTAAWNLGDGGYYGAAYRATPLAGVGQVIDLNIDIKMGSGPTGPGGQAYLDLPTAAIPFDQAWNQRLMIPASFRYQYASGAYELGVFEITEFNTGEFLYPVPSTSPATVRYTAVSASVSTLWFKTSNHIHVAGSYIRRVG